MPNNWKTYKLGQVADIQNGYAFKSKELSESGIPVIKIKNLVPPNVELEGAGYFNSVIDDKLKKYVLKRNDFLISMTGSTVNVMSSAVGKMAKYRLDDIALLNQRVGKIYVIDGERINSDYLYHYMNRYEIHYNLALNATGSANQANISPAQIKEIELNLPPLQEQQQIASILSALDNKIENNLAMNKTLKDMAMALYKHWFVDFGPFQEGEFVDSELGMIPKGWEVKSLNHILDIKYGKDHKKLEEGRVPVYGTGGIMRYVNQSLYDQESILIPRKGSLNNLFYIKKPFWTVDTLFYSKIKLNGFGKYSFHFLKSLDLASMDVGSAVPSLTTQLLNKINVIVPTNQEVLKYDEIVTVWFDTIDSNIVENQTLTQLRDTLLPKLISGEIRLQEFTATLANAL